MDPHPGPTEGALVRLRLCRGDALDALRESLVWAALAWLPLVLAGALRMLFDIPIEPFALDPSVHVRFLLAIPLIVLGRRIIAARCRSALISMKGLGCVDPRGRDPLAAASGRLIDWWSSGPVEIGLLVLAFGAGALSMTDRVEPIGRVPTGERLSAAGVWYFLVSLSIYRWVLLLALHRWLAWCLFLLRIARVRLALVASHPDRTGGLFFLNRPSIGLATVVAGAGATSIATVLEQVTRRGSLQPVVGTLFVIAGTTLVLGIVPLLAFSPQMVQARMDGTARYGRLGVRYVRLFEERHLAGPHRDPTPPSEDPDLLGSPDIQSLNDLGGAFDRIKGMRVVPFGRRTVVALLLVSLAPVTPLVVVVVPLRTIVVQVLRTALGIPL
jgi:hypothetical protein